MFLAVSFLKGTTGSNNINRGIMMRDCDLIPLPSGDAVGGTLCCTCGETFERDIVCPIDNRVETKMKQSTKKTTITKEFDYVLEPDNVERAIREYFGMPEHAEITFGIPGGGDYSNMDVDAATFDITATWKEVESW